MILVSIFMIFNTLYFEPNKPLLIHQVLKLTKIPEYTLIIGRQSHVIFERILQPTHFIVFSIFEARLVLIIIRSDKIVTPRGTLE